MAHVKYRLRRTRHQLNAWITISRDQINACFADAVTSGHWNVLLI